MSQFYRNRFLNGTNNTVPQTQPQTLAVGSLQSVQDGIFNGGALYIKWWVYGKMYIPYIDANAGSFGQSILMSDASTQARLAAMLGVTVSSWVVVTATTGYGRIWYYSAGWQITSASTSGTATFIQGFVAV